MIELPENVLLWLGVAAFFLAAFERLARLTPTRKDDQAVSWLYRLFAFLGVKVPDIEGGPKQRKEKGS